MLILTLAKNNTCEKQVKIFHKHKVITSGVEHQCNTLLEISCRGSFDNSWVEITIYFEHKIVNILLSIIFDISFGCSEELSH